MKKEKQKSLKTKDKIALKQYAYSTAKCLTPSPEADETSGDWIDSKAQQIYNWLVNDYSLEEAKSIMRKTSE